jgi:hypothetical protein
MVAFNAASDLPSNINTVERLVAWGQRVLVATSPQLLITEIAGASPELAVSASPFPVLSDPNDYHDRLICRSSFRLVPQWDGLKLWLAVAELNTNAIPAQYRVV